MSEKFYNTFEEMTKDIGEQSGEYVFEVKQKEIDQLKSQIEKMKCRENCGNDFEVYNSTTCPLYDFQNVSCPCDKWEME